MCNMEQVYITTKVNAVIENIPILDKNDEIRIKLKELIKTKLIK